MTKKQVYIVVRTLVKNGGLSKYVIDMYTTMAKISPNIELHLVLQNRHNDYRDLLAECGIHVHYITSIQASLLQYVKEWHNLFESHQIDIIHFQIDNLVLFYPIMLAKKMHVPRIIIQSHNSWNDAVAKNPIKRWLHSYGKRRVGKWATDLYAVSKEAAKWLYDESVLNRVQVIQNPVTVDKFKYSNRLRLQLRQQLSLNDNVVYGHVGRFEIQKNHRFLLKVFKAILERQPEARLLLIGTGSLKPMIESQIADYGLTGKVLLLGRREDIANLMNAMDCIIFPSLYEGFPITLIEGQATGVPIICADTIASSIAFLPTTKQLSLNQPVDVWANLAVKEAAEPLGNRFRGNEIALDAGYDLKTQVEKMAARYEQQ